MERSSEAIVRVRRERGGGSSRRARLVKVVEVEVEVEREMREKLRWVTINMMRLLRGRWCRYGYGCAMCIRHTMGF